MEALLQLKGIDKAFPGVKSPLGRSVKCLSGPRDGAGGRKRRG